MMIAALAALERVRRVREASCCHFVTVRWCCCCCWLAHTCVSREFHYHSLALAALAISEIRTRWHARAHTHIDKYTKQPVREYVCWLLSALEFAGQYVNNNELSVTSHLHSVSPAPSLSVALSSPLRRFLSRSFLYIACVMAFHIL